MIDLGDVPIDRLKWQAHWSYILVSIIIGPYQRIRMSMKSVTNYVIPRREGRSRAYKIMMVRGGITTVHGIRRAVVDLIATVIVT